jgi:hypothetical protein
MNLVLFSANMAIAEMLGMEIHGDAREPESFKARMQLSLNMFFYRCIVLILPCDQ